ELDRADRGGDALLDLLVTHAGGARALDDAVRADLELGHDRARELRLDDELLLVAVADLRQLATDVAADDVLVEVAGRRGVADPDRRRRRLAAAHPAPPRARAVAAARARAVADQAVVAGADRAPAGAA